MIKIFQDFFNSPTPSSFIKISAMWPTLQDETKIAFLTEFINHQHLKVLVYLRNNFCIFAFESINPYIRYLAVKLYFFGGWKDWDEHLDEKFREKIENDEHPLVKYSLLEEKYDSILNRPEKTDFEYLLNLDQQGRLAIVRLGTISGEDMSQLIIYFVKEGLPNKSITETEIYEIMNDYLDADYFKRSTTLSPACGGGAYQQGIDLISLWKLTLSMPKSISHILIDKLPANTGDFIEIIPTEVLEKLNDKQLKQLLWRSDVYLEKFRKEMFFKLYKEDNNSHSLLSAVSSHHFDLDNELDENLQTINEFGQILSEYQSEKLTIILSILLEANDLNPVIKLACGDCLETLTRNNVKINDWHHQFLFKKYKENIYRDFKNKTLEKSFILAIKLYNLAKKVVPWDKEKTGSTSYIEARQDLCFLLSSIHAKQTWATYQSFHEAWYADYDHESKNHLLPELTSASLDI